MTNFTIEVTTTQACNFNCEYCFERDFEPAVTILDKNISLLTSQISSIFNSNWASKFDSFQITFWGGEPSLNMKMIDSIVEYFKDNEKVHYFIYTNGSNIDELIKVALKVKPRFRIQVSYDGQPLHDLRRKTKDGKETSVIVRESLKKLKQNDIPYSIKSTVTYKDFHYIPEVWNDFYELRKELGKDIRYGLTVDYHHIEFSKYKDIIEKTLIEIAKKEMRFYKEQGEFLTNIFSVNNKAICSTGSSITVDTDGKVYLCHGCIYSEENKSLEISSIFNDTFLNDIHKNYLLFQDIKVPSECDNCVALTCLKCSVKKYEHSSKSNLIERWTDYSVEKEICDYYKLSGRIGRAMLEILKEDC